MPQHLNTQVIDYLLLRKLVGLLGIFFPIVLVLGDIVLFHEPVQPSLSAYYCTEMGNVFVGLLFAIGVFLFSYRGYARADRLAGYLACAGALGVALCPYNVDPIRHFTSAGLFFLSLAYFCFFEFTQGRGGAARKWTFRGCGIAIIVSCLCVAAYEFKLIPFDHFMPVPVLVFEILAIEAFGVSWFVKGF